MFRNSFGFLCSPSVQKSSCRLTHRAVGKDPRFSLLYIFGGWARIAKFGHLTGTLPDGERDTRPMRKAEITPEQIVFLKTRLVEATQEVFARRVASKRLDSMSLKPSKRSPDGVLAGLVVRASARGLKRAEQDLKAVVKFQRCGALTRRGAPCQCAPEPGRDRCKLHGGKSTGPRTEAIRESNRRRAQKRREDWQCSRSCVASLL